MTNNAVAGADPNLQFHLSVDSSQIGIGGVLFQIKRMKPGIEAATKFAENQQILLFLSYCLTDVEIRFGNSERGCLTMVRCLTDIKWLVINSPYKILIYSDQRALQDIFIKSDNEKVQINAWLDWFGEFKIQLVHRLSRDQHIYLADGLSGMPTSLMDEPEVNELPEQLAMSTIIPPKIESASLQILQHQQDCYLKYSSSVIYKEVLHFLKGGLELLQNLAYNKRKQI